jgi:hypothetical protein
MTAPVALTPDVVSGPCGHCKKTRPLTRYVPSHDVHLFEPDSYSCDWCMRLVQPFLCPVCLVAEAAAEERARPATSPARFAGAPLNP